MKTRWSRPPSALTARCIAPCTEAPSRTSAAPVSASAAPAVCISSANASSGPALTSSAATFAPHRAKASAVARPIPDAAPSTDHRAVSEFLARHACLPLFAPDATRTNSSFGRLRMRRNFLLRRRGGEGGTHSVPDEVRTSKHWLRWCQPPPLPSPLRPTGAEREINDSARSSFDRLSMRLMGNLPNYPHPEPVEGWNEESPHHGASPPKPSRSRRRRPAPSCRACRPSWRRSR